MKAGIIVLAAIVGGLAVWAPWRAEPQSTPYVIQRGELSIPEELQAVDLSMHEWSEEAPRPGLRIWADASGDILFFGMPDPPLVLPNLSDEQAFQHWSRSVAESQAAGLIQVSAGDSAFGTFASLIYKQSQGSGYIFTGVFFLPERNHVWTVVAGERGTTGVREAVVTAELFEAGKLTIQDYEQSWACDPYDSGYRGVDKSVLRFISDDEYYDGRFPDHPLSKVRRVLADLPNSIRIE